MLAPLGAGVTLFAFTQQLQFLALTLMSPLVLVANWIEDRRSGRHRFRRDLETFRASLDARRSELATLVDEERIERLRAAPDLADLARRAELRTTDLWARGRDAPDFLRLRVGLGTAPTLVTAPLERGGDEDLREEAEAAAEGSAEVAGVPITVDLAEIGVFGVHGSAELVDGVASALVVQSACLHSPEDLTIAAAVSAESPMAAWMKWLPHLRSVTSPLPGDHVAATTAGADELVARLLEVAEFRMSVPDRERTARRWPWILAVLDGRLDPDPAALAELLEQCPEAGISVVWMAETEAEVPRQAAMVLAARQSGTALTGVLWSTDPSVPARSIEVEQLRSDVADRVARSLAPVRDASTASLATSIPRTVPLLDVLGVGMPTAAWVSEQWHRPADGLDFPIGIAADGVFSLDLVADGPHALIGGTSGAGKSELLQSIVASLAVRHAPTRLTFLFVDYKGGAASAVFSELPHTVGYVTNLSAELSRRALTSLRAELNRRMRLLEGKAKDLAEMRELYPADAPPSLVIVVDEFATLVKEVPEFVDGIVDIAQRGRSLGIHLILATQRPSGAVNDNILANTNLRISLRMLDKAESVAVIDSGEAAEIPVPLKGRGWVRLGPRALVAFQAAYCGSPLVSDDVQAPVLVAPFVRTDDSPKVLAGPATAAGTHLDAVLRAVGEANRRLGLPACADAVARRAARARHARRRAHRSAGRAGQRRAGQDGRRRPRRRARAAGPVPGDHRPRGRVGLARVRLGRLGEDDAAAHAGRVGDHHGRPRRGRRRRPRLRLSCPRLARPAAAGRRRRHRRRSRGGHPSPGRARRRARTTAPPAVGGTGREPRLVQPAPRSAAADPRPRRRLRRLRLDVHRGQFDHLARAARELARTVRQPRHRRPPGRHPRGHDRRPARRHPGPAALGGRQPADPARRRRDGLHRARHPPGPGQGPRAVAGPRSVAGRHRGADRHRLGRPVERGPGGGDRRARRPCRAADDRPRCAAPRSPRS